MKTLIICSFTIFLLVGCDASKSQQNSPLVNVTDSYLLSSTTTGGKGMNLVIELLPAEKEITLEISKMKIVTSTGDTCLPTGYALLWIQKPLLFPEEKSDLIYISKENPDGGSAELSRNISTNNGN